MKKFGKIKNREVGDDFPILTNNRRKLELIITGQLNKAIHLADKAH